MPICFNLSILYGSAKGTRKYFEEAKEMFVKACELVIRLDVIDE